MSLTDYDLRECIASGQWRCTIEELQEATSRVLREKQELSVALLECRAVIYGEVVEPYPPQARVGTRALLARVDTLVERTKVP